MHTPVIFIQETWLDPLFDNSFNFNLPNYEVHFTSQGRGRGLASYYQTGYRFCKDISKQLYQMTKLCNDETDFINVYKAKLNKTELQEFMGDLLGLLNDDKETFILGDFNCQPTEEIFQQLQRLGFQQLSNQATHLQGNVLDHAYVRSSRSFSVETTFKYFSDHACISLKESAT
jgi:hypothetical protein